MNRYFFPIKSFLPILLLILAFPGLSAQEEDFVSIYDDLSDSTFGRSVDRSIIRGVRLDRFGLYRTLPVDRALLDDPREEGFLTPLVFADSKKSVLDREGYPGVRRNGEGRYLLTADGIDITFSLEKPSPALLEEIDSYYRDWPEWQEPVAARYRDNWVIRIHRAENVFEPWVDRIDYNEALLSAALIADDDQWLWGVHDGADYLLRK
ncbi:MAG: hypothetical protein JXA95_14435 [Spirochaetales bacterium]|nr:hypothetical protein [Spirochaetales bacterium]